MSYKNKIKYQIRRCLYDIRQDIKNNSDKESMLYQKSLQKMNAPKEKADNQPVKSQEQAYFGAAKEVQNITKEQQMYNKYAQEIAAWQKEYDSYYPQAYDEMNIQYQNFDYKSYPYEEQYGNVQESNKIPSDYFGEAPKKTFSKDGLTLTHFKKGLKELDEYLGDKKHKINKKK